MPVPAVNGVSAPTLLSCRALKNSLPQELGKGVRLRAALPTSDTTAAWGDPPVTLRCGVKAGSATDDPYVFDGVHWAMHDKGASRSWTTTGRPVNVVVEFPDSYSGQAELLGALAKAITTTLR
ncbi:MAG: DUF3515 family protein [Mycobacteriales bacterium]